MKKLEKSVPIIRFKGFYEAWEQRKVSDYAINTYGGGTPKTNVREYWSGEIPWIQSSDLLISNLFNVIPKKYITELAVKSSATKFIPANSIAIVSRVGVGKLVFMPFEYTTSQDFLSLSNLQVDSNFGVYSIYMMLQKELKNIQGTSIKGITKTDLLEKNINKPSSREEQQKIGAFFKQLDNTITLHQRKLDALKLMKKGLLQQMFPNNEEKVPRLRFADFNEKWERCKISSFARNTYGGGTPKTNVPEYWQGRIPWIQSGDLLIDSLFNIIPKKHVTGSAVKSSATKCIPANSIAIVTRVGVGKLAFIPFEYTTSQDFLSLSNLRVDSNFGTYSIYIMLQRELNNIQGSTIKGITKSDLLEKNINKPLNRIEQERIGVSLKLLDNIITLHQSKLEKLSSLKKVYLQRMFI
ncbi:restriction endonuclease subunit S [Listeria monocytogenes]|nr:restriction endonuclease subunit S [Listeria monocytogenes]